MLVIYLEEYHAILMVADDGKIQLGLVLSSGLAARKLELLS
jgi:hypothetical protein